MFFQLKTKTSKYKNGKRSVILYSNGIFAGSKKNRHSECFYQKRHLKSNWLFQLQNRNLSDGSL